MHRDEEKDSPRRNTLLAPGTIAQMGRLAGMTDLFTLCLFLSDAIMVGLVSWMGVCAAGLNARGLLESSLAWLLLALAWIAGSGALLELCGGLGQPGFLLMHAGGLAVLLAWRGKWRQDGKQWLDWLAGWRKLVSAGTPEGGVATGLLLAMLFLAVLAVQAEPMVYDALTYRLSRIGQWLQDGRIAHYQTDDPRLNYMPVGPDLVIAWLLGATKEGYRLAPLSQLAGGGLLLGATFGLARVAGLGRRAALGAIALVLGMANVAVQFTTIQSDLFTAGVFSASYFLWHRALLRGHGSWIAGIGFALAWGSKGTVLYLGPGAALWVGWLTWQHRQAWRALRPTAAAAGLAALILVLPGYWRNVASYGALFGPRDAVVLHHGDLHSLAQHAEKLALNLGTSAVQLLDPNSQPLFLQEFCHQAGLRLSALLPSDPDPYVFEGWPRRPQVEAVMRAAKPDSDYVTCGVLGVALFLGGLAMAGVRRARDQSAPLVLGWGGGVIIYILVQHALVQWHLWGFRFMVLAGPWMGVVGAWGISRLTRRWQVAAWAVAAVSALQVFVVIQWRPGQVAWQAVTNPDRFMPYYTYHQWREWAASLEPAGSPLLVALPINRPLAAFYRQREAREVRLARVLDERIGTAEQFLQDKPGWIIVPAARFMGTEGLVQGRAFRFMQQDGSSPYSLAAYRRLRPGEEPEPMLYRSLRTARLAGARDDLLVRSWTAMAHLHLQNPSGAGWKYSITVPGDKQEGMLGPHEVRAVALHLSSERVTQVLVDYSTPDETAAVPLLELVR
jgi:hypothetical protein